jgi:hypothetical protein
MQIVAYGAQDVYLTGNPQITFFKVVYRRHTNFAMESIAQTFNGNSNFGSNVSCTISRNGDLIHKMYLRVVMPKVTCGGTTSANWAHRVGLALIKNVELEIGGQRIDKQYGDWMNIWNELSLPESKIAGYDDLVGGENANDPIVASSVQRSWNQATDVGVETAGVIPQLILNVPLEFWFCRNPGLALPLIALQYHEVRVNFNFGSIGVCGAVHSYTSGSVTVEGGSAQSAVGAFSSGDIQSLALWVDYIYLDTDERRRFAQTSHEYLIEQLQYTGEESISTLTSTQRLNFNHPVKELIWVCPPDANVQQADGGHYQFRYDDHLQTNNALAAPDATGILSATLAAAQRSDGTERVVDIRKNPVSLATLKLNGHDRMAERSGDYYSRVQPFQHHTRVPKDQGINVYSFALKPEEHQPSGTCNMSRIDVAQLSLTFRQAAARKIRIYATNYNVLRIMSGMGGLAYAN